MVQKNKVVKKMATMAVTGSAIVTGLTPQSKVGMMAVPEIPETVDQSTQKQKVEALSALVEYATVLVSRNGYMSKMAGEKVVQGVWDNKEVLNTPDGDGLLPLFKVLNFKNHKAGAEQTSMETMAVLAKLMIGQGAHLDATMKAPIKMDRSSEETTVFDALLKTNPQMLKALDAEMRKGVTLKRVHAGGR